MKLSELLQNLALGELSSSDMVEPNGYEIIPKHIPKVINAVNQALDYFYSVFPLKESQLILRVLPNISRYVLDRDYALSNPESSLQYIQDTVYEPMDDVLQVLHVFTDTGLGLALNDPLSPLGVTTPEYNVLQLNEPVHQFKYLTVIYRAKHKRIPLHAKPSEVEVSIPSSFIGAFQTYVASLTFMFAKGDDNKQLSNILHAKYQRLAEELKNEGIGYKPVQGINVKPKLQGWI